MEAPPDSSPFSKENVRSKTNKSAQKNYTYIYVHIYSCNFINGGLIDDLTTLVTADSFTLFWMSVEAVILCSNIS